MGTETSYPIGTILRRTEPKSDDLDELRVVGGGKRLVVTSNVGFGENFDLDAADARKDYTTDIPDGVYLSQPQYINPGPSPEQVFSGESAPSDGLSRVERAARESDDPRTALESVRTDTGVPEVKEHNDTPLNNAQAAKPDEKPTTPKKAAAKA